MLMLAISDMHGDMASVRKAIETYDPELVLCCGDWGDSEELDPQELASAVQGRMVYSTFGNHDVTDSLSALRNPDGSNVLLEQGEVRLWKDWKIAAIGGIWAKTRKKSFHVTDEDVKTYAEKIARSGPLDILITHGCPIGMADLTPTGPRGGQRCFLTAFQTVQPSIHLCGHLHRAQEHRLKDGRLVINVGQTSRGEVVVLTQEEGGLSARPERFV